MSREAREGEETRRENGKKEGEKDVEEKRKGKGIEGEENRIKEK